MIHQVRSKIYSSYLLKLKYIMRACKYGVQIIYTISYHFPNNYFKMASVIVFVVYLEDRCLQERPIISLF